MALLALPAMGCRGLDICDDEADEEVVLRRDLSLSDVPPAEIAKLGCLTKIIGDFSVTWNEEIEDLHGLESLRRLRRRVDINNNPKLTSLEGLDGLEIIDGLTRISENGAMTSLRGLDRLTEVHNDLEISGDALLSLEGLGSLRFAEGLEVHSESLPSLEGLGPVLTWRINLSGAALTDVSALADVRGLGSLSLTGITVLEQVEVPDAELIYLRIGDAPRLASLAPFAGKLADGLSIEILNADTLTSLEGLEGPTTLVGLSLTGNAKLESLDALSTVTKVTGDVTITSNAALPGAAVEAWLAGVEVTGTLTVSNNGP